MRMKTKTNLVLIVVGLLSGAATTTLFTAVLFFTAFYFAVRENYHDGRPGWVLMAGLSGCVMGYVGGLVLGLFLGLTRRGAPFVALSLAACLDRTPHSRLHI